MKIKIEDYCQGLKTRLDIICAVAFLLSVEEETKNVLGSHVVSELRDWENHNCFNIKSE